MKDLTRRLSERDKLCFQCALRECQPSSEGCLWKLAGKRRTHVTRDWTALRNLVLIMGVGDKETFVFASKDEALSAQYAVCHAMRGDVLCRPRTRVRGTVLEISMERSEP